MESRKYSANEWMKSKWRPMMGWVYMITCITDFIIFPVLWAIFQAYIKMPVEPWNPLTLQGAGLYHMAMGAILGIAAYGRTKEKLAGMIDNDTPPTETVVTQTWGEPSQQRENKSPHVVSGHRGRPAPKQEEDPIL